MQTTSIRKKRLVSLYTKKRVAYNQKYICSMCTTLLPPEYEIDHKIPLFMGGSNDELNLQALCPNCHRRKTMFERESLILQRAENILDKTNFTFLEYDEYISRLNKQSTY